MQVFASNIYNSGRLACRFVDFPLVTGALSKTGSKKVTAITPGKLVTFAQVECPVPAVRVGLSSRYELSISHDGVLFSDAVQYIVFDPTCLMLEEETWKQKKQHMLL